MTAGEIAIAPEAAQQQGVAIRRLAHHILCGDPPACTDLVFHHHGLAERGLQFVCENPGDQVVAATGGKADNEANGF